MQNDCDSNVTYLVCSTKALHDCVFEYTVEDDQFPQEPAMTAIILKIDFYEQIFRNYSEQYKCVIELSNHRELF